VLAPDQLLSHAIKVFPKDKGDPAMRPELRRLLSNYFYDEEPDVAEQLRTDYGVDVLSLHLGRDAKFHDVIDFYFNLKKKDDQQKMRDWIKGEYGVDPEPLRLPRGVRVSVRGEIASMRESFREMAFNLALAVLLVYLVMTAQFGSWVDPLIMIVAAPLGLIGVLVMLWATGTSLNVQSGMGVLLMIGISVSNAVLLVEFANRKREEGLGTLEAVVQAARTRLRPILMTSVATVMCLLPMAIHLHAGDEMNLPLARAVIGGLAGSTLLTLFVVPVLYVLLKPAAPATQSEPAK